jgi:3-hydroxyisobutyrate dehydrogenase-like beta-hydroxyacid dehydrogenase
MKCVGFIGIGAMGEPMARCLRRVGFPVTACVHRNRAPMERLAADGVVERPDPAAVAAESEVVITIVPDAPEVEDAIFGARGAASGAKPGTIFVDMSTISPVATRGFAERLHAAGFRFLDAPVSGGIARAADGTLTIIVGADSRDLDDVRDVLQAMGTPKHVGGVGMGETVKLANQLLVGMIMLADVEALVWAAKAGADVDVVRDVILTATGANDQLAKRLPRDYLSGNPPSGFALDLLRKDLAAALDAGRSMKVPMPLSALAYQLYTTRSNGGAGSRDYSTVADLYTAPTSLRVEPPVKK